jgi:hypothetical protein
MTTEEPAPLDADVITSWFDVASPCPLTEFTVALVSCELISAATWERLSAAPLWELAVRSMVCWVPSRFGSFQQPDQFRWFGPTTPFKDAVGILFLQGEEDIKLVLIPEAMIASGAAWTMR